MLLSKQNGKQAPVRLMECDGQGVKSLLQEGDEVSAMVFSKGDNSIDPRKVQKKDMFRYSIKKFIMGSSNIESSLKGQGQENTGKKLKLDYKEDFILFNLPPSEGSAEQKSSAFILLPTLELTKISDAYPETLKNFETASIFKKKGQNEEFGQAFNKINDWI